MPPFIDLTKQNFNRLTILERIKNTNPIRWECQCACGNTTTATTNSLRTKKVQSCGCLRKELTTKRMTTHNMSRSPEYKSWTHMIGRCHNPTDQDFKNYGGRGIEVYQEWRDSFLAFYNYIGKRHSKKHSIDRINNEGNYCPGNIRWADRKTQNNNSRRNHLITIDGVTKTIAQWAKTMDISPLTICNRLQNNWTPEKSCLHPVRPHREDIITVNGIPKTTKQWAKTMNIRPGLITQRLLRGWSPEAAVFTPLNKKSPK